MNRSKAAITTIIPVILFLAGTVRAEPITTQDPAFSLKPGTPKTVRRASDPGRELLVKDLDDARPERLRNVTPAARDRGQLLIASQTPKMAVHSLDWGNGALTLHLLRTKSLRQPFEKRALTHHRFAIWSVDASFDQTLGSRDMLSLLASYDWQRRRPAYYLGTRNIYRTEGRSVAVQWTHDQRWLASLGYSGQRAGSAHSALERGVELAGGALPSRRGANLLASFSPTGDAEALALGLDLRRERYSARDADLLGNGSAHTGTRAAVFVQRSF